MSTQIFLIGFMGAGKSTVGRIVADRLERAFVDCDEMVEIKAGSRITDIFTVEGEEGFRERESRALASLADWPPVVAACGGGVVLRDENRRLLKEMGVVVYLEVTAGEALARVGEDDARPLIAGQSATMAETLLHARETMYAAVADITVPTVGRTPEEIADEIVAALRERGTV